MKELNRPSKIWTRLVSLLVAEVFLCSSVVPVWADSADSFHLRPKAFIAEDGGDQELHNALTGQSADGGFRTIKRKRLVEIHRSSESGSLEEAIARYAEGLLEERDKLDRAIRTTPKARWIRLSRLIRQRNLIERKLNMALGGMGLLGESLDIQRRLSDHEFWRTSEEQTRLFVNWSGEELSSWMATKSQRWGVEIEVLGRATLEFLRLIEWHVLQELFKQGVPYRGFPITLPGTPYQIPGSLILLEKQLRRIDQVHSNSRFLRGGIARTSVIHLDKFVRSADHPGGARIKGQASPSLIIGISDRVISLLIDTLARDYPMWKESFWTVVEETYHATEQFGLWTPRQWMRDMRDVPAVSSGMMKKSTFLKREQEEEERRGVKAKVRELVNTLSWKFDSEVLRRHFAQAGLHVPTRDSGRDGGTREARDGGEVRSGSDQPFTWPAFSLSGGEIKDSLWGFQWEGTLRTGDMTFDIVLQGFESSLTTVTIRDLDRRRVADAKWRRGAPPTFHSIDVEYPEFRGPDSKVRLADLLGAIMLSDLSVQGANLSYLRSTHALRPLDIFHPASFGTFRLLERLGMRPAPNDLSVWADRLMGRATKAKITSEMQLVPPHQLSSKIL